MGSNFSKSKEKVNKSQIYYAVQLKNSQEVSIIDSEYIKSNPNISYDEKNMYINVDYQDMNNNYYTETTGGDAGSPQRLKEIVKYWESSSRENIGCSRQSCSAKSESARSMWNKLRQAEHMTPSKGKLSWTNIEDGNKRHVKSTAAQVGSLLNIKDNGVFKNKSNNDFNSSSCSLNQREKQSEVKCRSQSASYENALTNNRKRLLKNVNQLDCLDTNITCNAENLTEYSPKMRDLDFRHKGVGFNSAKSRSKVFDTSESRCKKSEELKEDNVFLEIGIEDTNLKNDYIDARWQALCSSNGQELTLVPCPTCGRKFSQEAAYRHFPICSRVKEKCSSKIAAAPRRPPCNPSSPSFINVTVNDALLINDNSDEIRKPSKAIVYTFTRGGKKSGTPDDVKVISSSVEPTKQKSNSSPERKTSPATSKNGSGNSTNKSESSEKKNKKRKTSVPRSDGVRKSATIWRKSTKEFKTITDSPTKVKKEKESLLSVSEESLSSSKVDLMAKKITSEGCPERTNSRVCPTCGRTSNTSVNNKSSPDTKTKPRKAFAAKYKGGNKVTRSAKDVRESAPQSSLLGSGGKNAMPKVDTYIEPFVDKSEPCFFCGRLVRLSMLDSHSFLCERIKNIEVILTKQKKHDSLSADDGSLLAGLKLAIEEEPSKLEATENKLPKQLVLVKEGKDSKASITPKIASLKCPCCSEILDLRSLV